MEGEDPLDIDDIEIADDIHARTGWLALNARMADDRAIQLLAALREGEFILGLKFLRDRDNGWVLEDKFDSVRAERKKGQGEIPRDTKNRRHGRKRQCDHRCYLHPLPHKRPGPGQSECAERR